MIYLNHKFKRLHPNNDYWWKCLKCNIFFFTGETIKEFHFNIHNTHIKNAIEYITCEEFIIKQIIE